MGDEAVSDRLLKGGIDVGEAREAPYGSWKSPITSEVIAYRTLGLWPASLCMGDVMMDGEDVYWWELQPAEKGRCTVRRCTPDGEIVEVTPLPYSARTLAHSGAHANYAVADGTVYFYNYDDQRVYRVDPGRKPRPITPPADLRYADGVIDQKRGRMICVREDRTVAGREEVDTLVSLELSGSDGGEMLVGGDDFYINPRLSPDGSRLAWLTWHHPYMQWDETQLWVAEVQSDGSLGRRDLVAGGVNHPIYQPQWSPDGILYFIAEPRGWFNLYRWRNGSVEAVCEMEADFGFQWWNAEGPIYAFESPNRIFCSYLQGGTWHLASIDPRDGTIENIETPYSEMWSLRATPGRVVFVGGSPTEPASVVEFDLETRKPKVLYRSTELVFDESYLSPPEAIEFPTENGLFAHGFYYPPQNPEYTAPSGELPPLLVQVHGGPHACTSTTGRLDIRYFTSRGIAYLDVNYGGSTGYGHEYRKRMDGQWGVVDVMDAINGARYLVQRGLVDGNRLMIRGASSGGTATLCALTFHDVFRCGTSHYGDSDFELSVKITHKVESHYIDSLVGPYPEMRNVYIQRSPRFHTERLNKPVLFFQGLEDPSINPPQTELMVEALREQGKAVAYIPFRGEQHGFRRAENIKRVLDAELYFYSEVLGFELADPIEPRPVMIENL